MAWATSSAGVAAASSAAVLPIRHELAIKHVIAEIAATDKMVLRFIVNHLSGLRNEFAAGGAAIRKFKTGAITGCSVNE
ncbi:hypothetical protein JCM17478_16210 [Thermopirellula anaerolimosa]